MAKNHNRRAIAGVIEQKEKESPRTQYIQIIQIIKTTQAAFFCHWTPFFSLEPS